MNPSSLTHPDDEVLRAYGLAQLKDDASPSVGRHLRFCGGCQRRLASLVTNDFSNRLRDTLMSMPLTPPRQNSTISYSPTPDRAWPAELDSLPDHEILRRLDSGGMGAVYLARHKLLKRIEALKVIQSHLTERPQYVERFHREIEAAGRLDHPNIVPAYSAMKTANNLVLVMKYVEGQDLRQLVKGQGPLAVDEACGYALQVSRGLQHAHEQKIVHRDIKPANLILTKTGATPTVMVLDFGIAKFVRELEGDTNLTVSEQVIGTPNYSAPEQTSDPRKADIRADIYSLGCTLYYLLTGHPPFQAASREAISEAHRSKQAQPLNLARSDVSPSLARVVATMMAKDPAHRYQSPSEVSEALTPFASEDFRISDKDPRPPKRRPGPLMHGRKGPQGTSWPSLPGRLNHVPWISGPLARLNTTRGRILVGLVGVVLVGLVMALVPFNKGDEVEPPVFPPGSVGARVRVKYDTSGFHNAISNILEEQIPIEAGWTGVITELRSGESERYKVRFEHPRRLDVWILNDTLEGE